MARLTAGTVLLLFLATSLAAAQIVTPEDVEILQKGKEDFEAKCIVCHPLDVTVPKNVEEEGWLPVIERMVAAGADIQVEERERIAVFLESRTRFETSCATCHPKERCLSKKKTSEDWSRTVKRMSLLIEGGLAGKDGKKIVSYLSAFCPKE